MAFLGPIAGFDKIQDENTFYQTLPHLSCIGYNCCPDKKMWSKLGNIGDNFLSNFVRRGFIRYSVLKK